MGNAYILIHDGEIDSVAIDEEACEIQPTWNASVCTGDVGRLSFTAGAIRRPLSRSRGINRRIRIRIRPSDVSTS
jgi:hypothetical protein